MKFMAIIHRRLREGKTVDDYRKAWFHASGFGAPTTMYTVVNTFDPRELISIAAVGLGGGDFEETKSKMKSMLDIDLKDSKTTGNPLISLTDWWSERIKSNYQDPPWRIDESQA
jgi:hypothetical protein